MVDTFRRADFEATEVALPETCVRAGIRCRVSGVIRRRNYGPMLTLAVAEWKRPDQDGWTTIRDIATLMRLADAVSHLHDMPVNADKLYGPRGRMSAVSRKAV